MRNTGALRLFASVQRGLVVSLPVSSSTRRLHRTFFSVGLHTPIGAAVPGPHLRQDVQLRSHGRWTTKGRSMRRPRSVLGGPGSRVSKRLSARPRPRVRERDESNGASCGPAIPGFLSSGRGCAGLGVGASDGGHSVLSSPRLELRARRPGDLSSLRRSGLAPSPYKRVGNQLGSQHSVGRLWLAGWQSVFAHRNCELHELLLKFVHAKWLAGAVGGL